MTETQIKLDNALRKNKLQMHFYKESKKIESGKKTYGYRTCNNAKCRKKLPVYEMKIPNWKNNSKGEDYNYYLCPECYKKYLNRKHGIK